MTCLKNYIFELRNRKYLHDFVFDSVAIARYPELKPYFERIDRGEHPRIVLKDYSDTHIANRRYEAVFKTKELNETRTLRIFPNFGRHAACSFLLLPEEQMKRAAKRILIGMSQIDSILRNGRKTVLIEPNETGQHKGWKFVTTMAALTDEDGSRFPVTVDLKLAFDVQDEDRVYHINAKGTDTFNRNGRERGGVEELKGKFLTKGENVSIVVEAPSGEVRN